MGVQENIELTLNLLPYEAADPNYIFSCLRNRKELKGITPRSFKIIRRSIDARRIPVKINLGILVSEKESVEIDKRGKSYNPIEEGARQIIIVGAGPAGLFAGLKAIELGYKPIIVEKGKDVDSRKLDITGISREAKINPDSNYCFGEGGAGTFSDGKLYTRSKKRGNIREILEILHQFGASEDILIHSHPHIGSDKLPKIIKNIREKIRECGGEVKFSTKMENLILENGEVKGIETDKGEKIYGPVVLATGHSSRDTYRMLKKAGVVMESKGIAVGVRIEHPQPLIDRMQYHSQNGRGNFLPPAEYNFTDQAEGRGVYTFCMCPGGVIVPAVSEEGQIVVNGMSASARSGKWANSGYVVELHPGDVTGFEEFGEFEMMALQESLEKVFSEESPGRLKAPAQRIHDFIKGEISKNLPHTSYAPGIYPADFNSLFPKEISKRLKEGLTKIGRKSKEFIGEEGVMIGLESRTSSPVRIPRNPETFEHIEIKNLYPAGEGAGYAGGIVSSAIDGSNCVIAIDKKIKNGNNIEY